MFILYRASSSAVATTQETAATGGTLFGTAITGQTVSRSSDLLYVSSGDVYDVDYPPPAGWVPELRTRDTSTTAADYGSLPADVVTFMDTL